MTGVLTAIPLFDSPTALAEAGPRLDFVACGQELGAQDPYEALLARLNREHVPYTALLELTHICNFDCVMCYNAPLAEPELGTEEWLHVLDQLAEAGTLRLTLTGGEILTRRDFFTIAEHARRLSFALELKTNASLLTPESADRIAALRPLQVDISLLGATEATFDRVARSRRSLPRVLRGIQLLRERNVAVKLNTLLLSLNVEERRMMFDIARNFGIEYEQVVKVSSNDLGEDKATAHQLLHNEVASIMTEYQAVFEPRVRHAQSRTCKVGLSSCVISPYGEVYPCIELRISAGNLRRERFETIWHAPIFRELRSRHVWHELPECQICELNSYCEGRCSGLAWKRNGNLYSADGVACAQAQARYQQQHPHLPVPVTPLQAKL